MTDLSEHIHSCRTVLLKCLPKAETILSLGCAGKWYFDWFDKNYKYKAKRHIGIDLNDKPSDLKKNVEWIQGDGADLSPIEPNSIDLIFAGQFIEHIDHIKQAKLIYQANLILKNQKTLVMDSPNFSVVNRFGWKQPQHIRELSYDQIVKVLQILKFKVVKEHGIIPKQLVINQPKIENKRYLNSNFNFELSSYNLKASLNENVGDSFIWWVVATKESNAKETDFNKAISYLKKVDAENTKKTNRIVFHRIGKLKHKTNPVIEVNTTETGYALYGPYITVSPGKYKVSFDIKNFSSQPSNRKSIILDITTEAGNEILAKKVIRTTTKLEQKTYSLIFKLNKETILEFRAYSYGKSNFQIGMNPIINKL